MIPTKYFGYAKAATKFIASTGVVKIVHDIVASNVTVETKMDSIRVFAGTAAIASTISYYTSEHIDARISELEHELTEMIKVVNSNTEQ